MKDKYNQIARLKCFHLTFWTMFDFFCRYNVINVFGGLAAKETRLSISKASIALFYCFCFSFLFPIFSIKFWLYWIFERCNSLEPGGLYYWLILLTYRRAGTGPGQSVLVLCLWVLHLYLMVSIPGVQMITSKLPGWYG